MNLVDLAGATLAQQQGAGLMGFLPIILMFVVLYFLMIRPQIKRQKEHKNMVDNLTVGAEVITAGGLVGRINRLTDSGYMALEVADLASKPVEIMVQRQAVTAVLPQGTIKGL